MEMGEFCLVGRQAGSLAELGLELLEAHRGLVRGSDELGVSGRGDQRDPGRIDGQDLDDPEHQVIQDPLDREVGGHVASELAEHVGQAVIGEHGCPRGSHIGVRGVRADS